MRTGHILKLSLVFCLLQGCTIPNGNEWPANEKKIILSFDDGPNGEVSKSLLDVLAKHQVKASFCYVGRNVKAHPEIVERAIKEGHEIIIHSYSRRFPTLFDTVTLQEDIEKTRQAIHRVLKSSEPPLEYYRPPSGLITPAVNKLANRSDLKIAYLNFYARDSANTALDKDK